MQKETQTLTEGGNLLIQVKTILINDLPEYIDIAFENDYELLELYDKSIEAKNLKEVCESVYNKIKSISSSVELRGVVIGDRIVGFFAFQPECLLSFGINKEYRGKSFSVKLWGLIKNEIGVGFSCTLFDYNKRAIHWLEKQGMETIFTNLTILICPQ